MKYRPFGKLDWQVSALGFGTMRLPVLDGDNGRIDEPQAIAMLRHGIDSGINYVDTAWGYHREQSEGLVGKALQDGYRTKVRLATKMPSWLIQSRDDFDRYFNVQLERLQTDHIDFYLLHTLRQDYWDNYLRLKVFDWAEKKMAEGAIGHLGFSFHDRYPVFETILNGYDNWTFCQIQYNYMDIDEQAGLRGLLAAADKGLAVVIMEPLRGGSLVQPPLPAGVNEAFATGKRNWGPVEWALHWLWDQKEVSLLLSGMSTPEQLEQNLRSADESAVGFFTKEDQEVICKAQDAWRQLTRVNCSACEYCLPCPNGVNIPEVFKIYNNAVIFDRQRQGQGAYRGMEAGSRADNCIECGACEAQCPQSLPIINALKEAHSYLQTPPKAA